jgi:predicted PurR-regulated permease PerM
MNPDKLIERAPAIIAMIVLLAGAGLILLPFLSQIVWAAILVYVTRHIYWRFDAWLGHRHVLSASLFVVLIFALIIVPLVYGLAVLSVEAKAYVDLVTMWMQNGMPSLPHWITSLPWIGQPVDELWNKLVSGDPEIQENLKAAAVWLANFVLRMVGLLGKDFGLLLLSVVIAGFIYASLDTSSQWFEVVMAKLYPGRSEELMKIIGGTVQGVVFGILGTALAQSTLMLIGLFIAGVPSAVLFGAITFVLALIPAGPVLVWVPASIWLFYQGDTGWAIFLFLWGMLIVSTIDNLVKPLLIGKGSDLPFLLIILGMLGGVFLFGVLGIFIGPTLLALAYTLLREWAFTPVVVPESLVNVTVNILDKENEVTSLNIKETE